MQTERDVEHERNDFRCLMVKGVDRTEMDDDLWERVVNVAGLEEGLSFGRTFF